MLFELPTEMLCAIIDVCSFSSLLQLRLTCAAGHEAIDLFKKRELLLLDEIKANNNRCPYCILYKDEHHELETDCWAQDGICFFYRDDEYYCSSCRRTFMRCEEKGGCGMIYQYTGCSGYHCTSGTWLNNLSGKINVYADETEEEFNKKKLADNLTLRGKKLNVSEIHYVIFDNEADWSNDYDLSNENWHEEELIFGLNINDYDIDITGPEGGYYAYYKCIECGNEICISDK